jgi:hypothetical protein
LLGKPPQPGRFYGLLIEEQQLILMQIELLEKYGIEYGKSPPC